MRKEILLKYKTYFLWLLLAPTNEDWMSISLILPLNPFVPDKRSFPFTQFWCNIHLGKNCPPMWAVFPLLSNWWLLPKRASTSSHHPPMPIHTKVGVRGVQTPQIILSFPQTSRRHTAFQVDPGSTKRSRANSKAIILVFVSHFRKRWCLNHSAGSFWENIIFPF